MHAATNQTNLRVLSECYLHVEILVSHGTWLCYFKLTSIHLPDPNSQLKSHSP